MPFKSQNIWVTPVWLMAKGKGLGRNGFWNTKSEMRENSIWWVYWLELKHGDYYSSCTQNSLTGLKYFCSLIPSSSAEDRKREGKNNFQKLLVFSDYFLNLLKYHFTLTVCDSSIAVSCRQSTALKHISFPLTLKQISSGFYFLIFLLLFSFSIKYFKQRCKL